MDLAQSEREVKFSPMPDFEIEANRQILRSVGALPTFDWIFCVPGSPSSGLQWINLHHTMSQLFIKKNRIGLVHAVSSNVYSVRNSCIAKAGHATNQKPLQGSCADYKGFVWIDSDNYTNPAQIERLISHNVDIVGGWSRQVTNGPIADTDKTNAGWRRIEYCNEEDKKLAIVPLKEHAIQAITVGQMRELAEQDGISEVDWLGFGLILVRKGVFEAIGYPWFRSWTFEFDENGERQSLIVGDDDGFCIRAKEAGFKIYVDPKIQSLHEKRMCV
jgi:hypothetical protein